MEISVKLYSRIGELMQGVLPDASAFLVSGLPSEQWFSEATLRHETVEASRGMSEGHGPAPAVLPPKAQEALAMLEQQAGRSLPREVQIALRSNIPWGKGLSSSSTDVLSVLSVANTFLEAGLSDADLYRIASRVEPTDPCLSDDILVFYQHTGSRGATIQLPPVTLLYFDTAPAVCVDTLNVPRPWQEGAGVFFSWLLRRFMAAAETADYGLLFDAITYSAEYNQQILPTRGFTELYRLAEESGAALMVAHSGTIAGLLTKPEGSAELMVRLEALAGAASPVYSEQYHSSYH